MTDRLRYGTPPKVLHWLVVALLAVQFSLGWLMPDVHAGPPGRARTLHISLGLTILALILLRLVWRITHPVAPESSLPPWQRVSAATMQGGCSHRSGVPWLLRGVDFDNDSAFMNDVVVPWCREQKLEVTRSRAYKKNDQAFVEQKNGAVVRRLMGYGRFDGIETARVMGRLYAAARLYVNFFQPSFKLKEKRREGG
jgi:hypothetical protein